MRRLVLLVPAAVSLFLALDAGLFRIGWPFPLSQLDLPLAHGPLMVSGFLGTLIGLEKAVALKRSWAYLGPAATGIGGISLVVRPLDVAPRLLFAFGSAVLVAVCVIFLVRHRTTANASIAAGALLWALGNVLWLAGWPIFAVVPSWVGFLLLTIAGERLELNRLMRPSRASRIVFYLAASASLAAVALASSGFLAGGGVSFTDEGNVFSSAPYQLGVRILGVSLLALGLWLLSNDIARVAIRKPGLTRFMALSLLLGYGWLVVSGALWTFYGGVVGGEIYDAVLHGFFLGFVFSMIFAHGPVIFPSILERPLPFRRRFYAHVALLHFGLVVRFAGDLGGVWQARPWGGLLNAAAIVLFLASTAVAVVQGPGERANV